MRNILLKIEYNGTRFSGWQRQKNAVTVQGEIERVLAIIFKGEVKISGTSRTDAGVHALGQCATLRVPDGGIPTDKIPVAANSLLADDRLEEIGDIKILEAKEMPEGFHARHSAKGKRYIYKIYNSPDKSPFRKTQFYQISKPLDIEKMRKAAAFIEGTHDFKCFETSGGTPRETTVRTIYRLSVEKAGLSGDEIIISVSGDGFLYNMVRIIVGTLVEAGLGRLAAEDIPAIIKSKDRGNAGHTAPPQGLYLDEVFFS